MTTFGLLLLGAIVGVLSAMMGIGGGIVLVPALVDPFRLQPNRGARNQPGDHPVRRNLRGDNVQPERLASHERDHGDCYRVRCGRIFRSEAGPSTSRILLTIGIRRSFALPGEPIRLRHAAGPSGGFGIGTGDHVHWLAGSPAPPQADATRTRSTGGTARVLYLTTLDLRAIPFDGTIKAALLGAVEVPLAPVPRVRVLQ